MKIRVLMVIGIFLSVIASAGEMKIKVVTWNHMCQEDAFADGWGTPKEIMMCMEKNNLQTQDQITDKQKLEANTARFNREADFLGSQDFDLLLLQESEDISRDIFQKNTKYRLVASSAQDAIFISSESDFWKNPDVNIKPCTIDLNNFPDFKDKVDGIACAVVTVKNGTDRSFQVVFCSTHAKSGKVKGLDNIRIFEAGLKSVIGKMFPNSEVIIGGDYNLDFNKDEVNKVFSADWDVLVPKGPNWFGGFTTQHETNFYGAFDGYLVIPRTPVVPITVSRAERIVAGLMPKYLGKGPVTGHGADCGDSLLQYDENCELIRADTREVIQGCNAKTQAMSDHLPIEISIIFKR